MKNKQFNTTIIREGCQTTNEQEHSEAIFMTMMLTLLNESSELICNDVE